MAEKTPAPVPAKSGGTPSIFSLRDRFDELFDSMLRGWPSLTGWREAQPLAAGDFDFAPRVDTAETDAAYEVTIELPGVEEKDVKVSVEDDMLSISGEKKAEREEKKKNYYMSERSYGSFRRSFTLPDNVAADKIGAKFEKGVLSVTLPKTAPTPAKQRTIPIGKA
jgi:HSP20 family protein